MPDAAHAQALLRKDEPLAPAPEHGIPGHPAPFQFHLAVPARTVGSHHRDLPDHLPSGVVGVHDEQGVAPVSGFRLGIGQRDPLDAEFLRGGKQRGVVRARRHRDEPNAAAEFPRQLLSRSADRAGRAEKRRADHPPSTRKIR